MTDKEYSNADFADKFFPGAEVVSVEIQVLKETYDAMVSIIQQNGWELGKGLRILLCKGLGFAQGQLTLEAEDEERANIANRVARTESLYAVMKFETYHMMLDNQTLERRDAAMRSADKMSKYTIDRLRSENEALLKECDGLRIAIAELRVAGDESPASANTSVRRGDAVSLPTWWQRVFGRSTKV